MTPPGHPIIIFFCWTCVRVSEGADAIQAAETFGRHSIYIIYSGGILGVIKNES